MPNGSSTQASAQKLQALAQVANPANPGARLTDGLLGVKLEPYVHTLSAGLLPDWALVSLARNSAAASAACSAAAFAAARRASRSRAAANRRKRHNKTSGFHV